MGRNGAIRECNALVDPCSEYCVIPKVDAYALGYPEAANDDPVTPAENTITYTSFDGYGKAPIIDMSEVKIGGMAFRNVDFVAFDIPQITRFDVVLGRSLLLLTKLEVDFSTGILKLRDAKEGLVA